MKLFGSDGLFSPDWKIAGSYDSFFPVATDNPVVKAYAAAHGGNGEYFGAPSFVAAQVAVNAITKACKAGHGKTTRLAVRRLIARTNLRSSILGLPVAFTRRRQPEGWRLRHLPDPGERLVQADRLARSLSWNAVCGPSTGGPHAASEKLGAA